MHALQDNLEQLEGNVKTLLRKLDELMLKNQELINENNKLKEELQTKEVEGIDSSEIQVSTNSSGNPEEKYHRIKKELLSCINEIDECVQLIQ